MSTMSALPVFEPKVPSAGVAWEQRSQQWRARCDVGGLTRNFYVKPTDHSEAELERFLPSGSGLEEEAGEGEGEDGKVQAKGREEAPQVQQPEVLSCKYRKASQELHFSTFKLQDDRKIMSECRKTFRSVMSLSRPFMYFFHV